MGFWSFAVFLAVVLTISGLIHGFLLCQLTAGLGITSPAVLWPLRALALVLATSYIAARLLLAYAPRPIGLAADWVASVWLGLMFHLLWIGLLLWIAKVALKLTGAWARLAPHHAVLGRSAVAVAALAAVGLAVAGMIAVRRPALVRAVRVPVKAITPELRRLRIAVAADFHAGGIVSVAEVDRFVTEIMSLSPDLILLPGDILDVIPARMSGLPETLARLRAPLGVYATTGNHEYYVGAVPAVAGLRAAGLGVLMNERVDLPGGLVVAGVEDRTARSFGRTIPPFAEVLSPEARERPAILLSHTPDAAEAHEAAAAGADLVLSGHTHGGQIWPFSLAIALAYAHPHGLYPAGRGWQLTTCGLGWWGPPMRLFRPREILLLTLVGPGEPPEFALRAR